MLDELPGLCKATAAGNTKLASLLARAHVFKVSFENGTPFQPVAEAGLDGDSVVGIRMLWQLTKTTGGDFSAFRSHSTCTIGGALDALSVITGVPRDKQVVFLLVDGLQTLLPAQQSSGAAALDPVTFRSAINAVSACVNGYPECVVGAIAATLAIPIRDAFGTLSQGGSQQARVYLEPPPLSHPADVVPDIPSMPLLGILRGDMGGNGRALELLASCLYAPGSGALRPFASVATGVIAGLTNKFEAWTSATGVQQLWEPLLYAVIARRRLALSDCVPGTSWTVDNVRSLGLIRFVTTDAASGLPSFGYLEMAVALLQVIRAELRPGPLTTLVPDYAYLESTDRTAKNWQDFEDFVANFRAIKVAAFQDMASVPLSVLHEGAILSAAAAAADVRVPLGPSAHLAVRVQRPTTRFDTATFALEADSFGVPGCALRDVVLNGVSASAGDIFLRLDRLDRSSGKFVPELEVLACRNCQKDMNAAAFDCELHKALGDRCSTSFFLFVTSARVNVDFGSPRPELERLPDSDGSGGETVGGAGLGPTTRRITVRILGISLFLSSLKFTRGFRAIAGGPVACLPSAAPRRRECGLRRRYLWVQDWIGTTPHSTQCLPHCASFFRGCYRLRVLLRKFCWSRVPLASLDSSS